MTRKAAVTQVAVNQACETLLNDNKNVTVNAVISMTGGSFSTVGGMVKAWKEEQAAQSVVRIEMPDTVTQAMHKAAADIWATASSLAGETVERIQAEAGEAITKAKAELTEYAGEVGRLENELEQKDKSLSESDEKLEKSQSQLSEITIKVNTLVVEKGHLKERLEERDEDLLRLRGDIEKLQNELMAIAKWQTKQNQENSN